MAKLVRLGNGTEYILPINGQFTIGRDSNNTVCVMDACASRQHCRIYVGKSPSGEEGKAEYMLEDKNSTNGTFVSRRCPNGKMSGESKILLPTPLQEGMIIRIGETPFQFI